MFVASKIREEQAHETGKEVVCSLMLNEMSIRKHIQWDGYKFCECFNIRRVDNINDTAPPASEVLAYMIALFNFHRKMHYAYFLLLV